MAEKNIDEFLNVLREISNQLDRTINYKDFQIIDRGIPHEPPTSFPEGKTGVYTFYFPKGECFLKIGKVGPKSKARFTSQHYNPKSAKSSLACSLLSDKEMRAKYNFSEDNIKSWIMNNCRRVDILFDISLGKFANELCESFLHFKYEPKYEG